MSTIVFLNYRSHSLAHLSAAGVPKSGIVHITNFYNGIQFKGQDDDRIFMGITGVGQILPTAARRADR